MVDYSARKYKNMFTSEIYDLLESAPKEDHEEILRQTWNHTTEQVIYHTFAPEVEFYRDTIPEYKPLMVQTDYGYDTIENALKRVYLFIKNHPRISNNMTEAAKDKLLVDFLEMLGHREADVFAKMIMKKPGTPALTEELVRKVAPNFLPPNPNPKPVAAPEQPVTTNTYKVDENSTVQVSTTEEATYPERNFDIPKTKTKTIWITNGSKNEKVEIDSEIPEGWKRGRTMTMLNRNKEEKEE